MYKKIFKNMQVLSVTTLVLALILILSVCYTFFNSRLVDEMKNEIDLLASTLNMLEEIGAINRRNLYKFSEMTEPAEGRVITVMLEDGGKLHLDAAEWNRVLQTGLRDCGYLKDERVLSVKNVYKTDAI